MHSDFAARGELVELITESDKCQCRSDGHCIDDAIANLQFAADLLNAQKRNEGKSNEQ